MKHFNRSRSLFAFALLFLTAALIYSCKKGQGPPEENITFKTVDDAKAWYDQNYPVKNSSKSSSLSSTIQSTDHDLTQILQPDWNHAEKFARDSSIITEVPIADGRAFGMGDSTAADGGRNRNKSSYVLIKKRNTYQAFLFVIIADAEYLNGNVSKLKLNSFKQYDPDFSGKIYYFTPKGQLISGWKLKAGKIIASISRSTVDPKSNKASMELSCSTSSSSSLVFDSCMGTDGYMTCYYHWETTYTTVCSDIMTHNPDPGGGGETPNFPLPPMPDPNDPALKDVINQLTGCNGQVLNKLKAADLKNQIGDIINKTFGTSDKVNINFYDAQGPQARAALSAPSGVTRLNGQAYYEYQVSVSNSMMPANASQEYRASLLIHEIIHAYQDQTRQSGDQIAQHLDMAKNYSTAFAETIHTIFGTPMLEAYSFAFKGMRDLRMSNPSGYEAAVTSKGTTVDDVDTNYDAYADGTKGTHCP